MYIYLKENKARDIIPDRDEKFPSVPIENRYAPEYLEKCVYAPDDTDVKTGMIYDPEDGSFGYPPVDDVELSPPYDDTEDVKSARITESKDLLSKWLSEHPMTYTDGKSYSVTEEKQSLLNGNLASYERAAKLGIDYPLRWNSTDDECTEWEYDELIKLSLSIAAYVAPKVSVQQEAEVRINACSTADEVRAIVISYD